MKNFEIIGKNKMFNILKKEFKELKNINIDDCIYFENNKLGFHYETITFKTDKSKYQIKRHTQLFTYSLNENEKLIKSTKKYRLLSRKEEINYVSQNCRN